MRRSNPTSTLLGAGVTLGALPGTLRALRGSPAFQHAAALADLNATHAVRPGHGMPVLVSRQVQQWAQHSFSLKPLPAADRSILFRLCEPLAKVAIVTSEAVKERALGV